MTELWVFPLDCSDEELQIGAALLSQEELDRAARFRFPRHRRRFIVRRAIRRVVLGHLVDAPPASLEFVEGEKGKPSLRDQPIAFNASHSRECGVIVTGDGRLGVDIEPVDREIEHRTFAAQSFTAEESSVIDRYQGRDLALAFFNCWTGKEAYIKALGDGLSKSLKSFAVSCHPEQPAGLLYDREHPADERTWSFHRVSDGQYLVTVVTPESAGSPQHRMLELRSMDRGTPVTTKERGLWVES